MKRLMVSLACLGLVFLLLFAGCTTQNQSAPGESGTTGPDAATAAGTAGGEKQLLRVGIDAVYPPFSFMSEKGEATGFDVESMRWIATNQGYDVEFHPIAWDGIIPALNANKIDLVYAGMTITDERKEKVNFSKPYWTVNQTVVTKEGSPVTLDEVKTGNVTIGTQRGCTAAIWVEENLINTTLMSGDSLKLYDNAPLAVEDLVNGRTDAVIYDSTVMNDIIAGKPVQKIGVIETNEQFGIAVRKTDTALLEKLNAGLDNLMSSPEWQDLIQKYKLE